MTSIETDLNEFRRDLQEGMRLEDALIKHNLTFKEACDKSKNFKGNGKYHNIYLDKNTKKFRVEKMVNSKMIYAGSFEDLDKAVRCRDFYEQWGWDTKKVFK